MLLNPPANPLANRFPRSLCRTPQQQWGRGLSIKKNKHHFLFVDGIAGEAIRGGRQEEQGVDA